MHLISGPSLRCRAIGPENRAEFAAPMPKDARICKGRPLFLSDLCKPSRGLPAYFSPMIEVGKAEIVLKPVLIGFLLGLALVGASRLASQEADRTQLTSAQAQLQAHGAAIGHVSGVVASSRDCGQFAPTILI